MCPNDPDSLARGIHFGCGAIFGFFAGLLTTVEFTDLDWTAFTCLAVGVASALVCGWLAREHGDDFWRAIFRWPR